MPQPYITKIPILIVRLIILLFIINVVAKLTFPLYAPKLIVRLEIEPTACEQLEFLTNNHNPLFGFNSTGQTISLDPNTTSYQFPLNSLARTAMWKFCPGSEITIKGLSLLSANREINLSLTDTDHLMCYDCISEIQAAGELKLIPNPSRVSFQLGGVYEYVNAELPKPYLIIYRSPQIIIALFLALFALSALPLTINILEYLSYCFMFGLFIMYRWHSFRLLFPGALYTSNRIIADAQYLGFSLIADFAIMGLLLAVPLIFALLLQIRNRFLCRNRPTFKARLVTLGVILGILFWLITYTSI